MILKFHKELTPEKWKQMGKGRQILNILSELNRAKGWLREKDQKRFCDSMNIAFELLDLTVEINTGPGFRKECLRLREELASYYVGQSQDDAYFVQLMRALSDFDRQSHLIKATLN